MKVFLMFLSFMFFSFLWAEEPQTPAQEQTAQVEAAPAEASAEKAPEAASAEASAEKAPESAPAAPAENAVKPAEEPKSEEAKEPAKTSKENTEDEQGYNLKLRALEEKIDSLKDKIFKSKQRLAILQETVLGGTVGGSTVTVIHKNTVGALFKLVSAVYYLDDKPIFKKVDLPEELEEREFQIYDAAVVPGPHRVSVYFVYVGKGYGVFSYLKDYSIKINADNSFTLEEGDMVEVEVSAFDKGGMYSFDNRIGVAFAVDKNTFENRD